MSDYYESDPDYTPSQTPESEDYTSYESSSLETESESDYSIACSEDCSDVTESSELSYVTESSDVSSITESSVSSEYS